jgi:hypothetical protein
VSREPWNPVNCCPANVMRLLASVHQYLATSDASGVQMHHYAPGTLRAVGDDGRAVELAVRTGYPWHGKIELEVRESGEEPWTLSLRVPAWATAATLDGEPVPAGGYVQLERGWRVGDRVTLALEIAPRLTAPNPRLDAVRGCLAIERGPLVYCIEDADMPEGVALADVRLDAAAAPRDGEAAQELGNLPTVTLDARVVAADGWSATDYRDVRDLPAGEPAGRTVTLSAIPYFAWANRASGSMRVWIPTA